MASITIDDIDDIDDKLKERLHIRAIRQGRSVVEEARIILRRAVNGISGPELLSLSERLFGEKHGVELELPSRVNDREIPDFNRG